MKLEDILSFLNDQNVYYELIGDKNCAVNGFSSLKSYVKGTLTWIKSPQNYQNQPIDCCITGEKINGIIKTQIVVDNGKKVFFDIIDNFFTEEAIEEGIGDGSIIDSTVSLGENVRIGSNCIIKGKVIIGKYTVIEDGAVIKGKVNIGEHCHIQSNATIGDSGFGYSEENGIKKMIKHYGGVLIGNNVHIGANTCVARGTIDDTVIESGSKIDNLCHVAHNVRIGKNVTLVAGSIIYGSVTIGANSYIATSIIRNQINVGEHVTVGMGSVILKDIPDGVTVVGVPGKLLKA